MTTKMERYLAYVSKLHWQANNLLMQADPNTAHGEGLDQMASALCISPRKDAEVDQELRNRILEALGIQTW